MTPPVFTEHPLEQGMRRWGKWSTGQAYSLHASNGDQNVNMCIPLNSLLHWLGGKVSRAYWSSLELRMCFKTLKKQNWETGILMYLLQLQDSQFWKHWWTFPRNEEAAAFRSLLVVGRKALCPGILGAWVFTFLYHGSAVWGTRLVREDAHVYVHQCFQTSWLDR